MSKKVVAATLLGVFLSIGSAPSMAADADTQAQLDALKAAIPKFAIPMREVGDRFQNIWFAAKDGNWALAAYMSKYMNGSLNPAKLTKPDEYAIWKKFYEEKFANVNDKIMAKDFEGFDAAYTKAIADCNGCHKKMDYGFIKVVKMKTPADIGIDYTVKSEPGDVPK
ncbi:hypothetical protein [Rhodoferax sp. GW822-FHT02A01]|uniref:hypothetical protein n=1 Tax=Rhodoferax sp. GW822-FHT02A01 TaxID=3141537 RepID=UPI00315D3CE1